jgi:hypothetical protein
LLRARLQLRERLSRYFHKKKGRKEARPGEARHGETRNEK